MWGSVALPAREVLETLLGQSSDTTNSYIVLSFRLPKALTAVIAGAGVSIAGLLMQTLFRNPLADTSILGINSGAGVGVAIYTMAATLAPGLFQTAGVASTWGIIGAACLGAMGVLLAISVVSSRLHDLVSVLPISLFSPRPQPASGRSDSSGTPPEGVASCACCATASSPACSDARGIGSASSAPSLTREGRTGHAVPFFGTSVSE